MPRAGPAITFVEPLVLYTRLLRAPPAVIRSAHDGRALPSFRTSLKGRCIPQATHCWNGPLGRLSSESGACQLKPSAIWAWPHIVGCGQHTAPGAAAAAGAWNAHGLARRPSPMASVARREFVTRSRDKNTDALRCERRQKVRNPVSNQASLSARKPTAFSRSQVAPTGCTTRADRPGCALLVVGSATWPRLDLTFSRLRLPAPLHHVG